ncbi:murein biosynthesis integral membrane protein MurJ [Desulfovibrio sp. OttesenSCG-928-C14]|nr:murein biosynthesis integral membrane protein MurJ [Desulfovibrio sp. OttesenSCG-928-C14]
MEEKQDTFIVRNAAKIGLGFSVSRSLGLCRDIVIAFVLGGGWAADIFLAAMRLPYFIRRVLYEGAMALAFLPIFDRLYKRQTPLRAFTFGRTALWECFLAALIFCLLCIYAAKAIATLLVPGFAAMPEMMELTGSLMQVTFFYLPLVAVSVILGGMLLAMDRYIATAIAPACMNIGIIFAGVCVIFGDYSAADAIRLFCYGMVGGGVLQVLIQLPPLYRAGFRILGPMELHSHEARSFTRNAPPAMIGSSSYQMGVLIAMFMASFLGAGNVSALYFAERIIELPIFLVGIGLGLASLPDFSRMVMREQKTELTHELRKITAIGLFFSLPACFGIMALAWPIVYTIFAHGAFDAGALDLTAQAMFFYAPLLPGIVMARPMLAALNAGGRSSITMFIAFVSLALLIGLTLFLLNFLGLEAVTISATVSVWANTIMLALVLRRSGICAKGVSFYPWRLMAGYLLFSIAMFALLVLLQIGATYLGFSPILSVLVGVPLGAGVYFAMCYYSKSPELLTFLQVLGLKK